MPGDGIHKADRVFSPMNSLGIGRIENHPVATFYFKVVGRIRIRIGRVTVKLHLGKVVKSIMV
jgi:hypothetical protein